MCCRGSSLSGSGQRSEQSHTPQPHKSYNNDRGRGGQNRQHAQDDGQKEASERDEQATESGTRTQQTSTHYRTPSLSHCGLRVRAMVESRRAAGDAGGERRRPEADRGNQEKSEGSEGATGSEGEVGERGLLHAHRLRVYVLLSPRGRHPPSPSPLPRRSQAASPLSSIKAALSAASLQHCRDQTQKVSDARQTMQTDSNAHAIGIQCKQACVRSRSIRAPRTSTTFAHPAATNGK